MIFNQWNFSGRTTSDFGIASEQFETYWTIYVRNLGDAIAHVEMLAVRLDARKMYVHS